MDRFDSLRAFVFVAEAESFSNAARSLGVSKAVVSERVRQLEALVRSPLFHRTTRSVRLTERGLDLLPEARSLVYRLGDLENSLPDPEAGLYGRLRIASIVDFGISHIAPAVADFAILHPELNIEFVVSDRVVNPLLEGYDIAIHFKRLVGAGLSSLALCEVANGLFASPAYLSAAAQLHTAADLKIHRCVGYSAQTTTDAWDTQLWSLDDGQNTETVAVRLAMVSNSGHVLKQFALKGHGIAVLPLERIATELAEGSLVRVLPTLAPETLRLVGAIPEAQRRQRKLQALVSHIQLGLLHKS